jgi:hypothetical protein
MSAHHDIDLAVSEILYDLARLGLRQEARQHLDSNGKVAEPLGDGRVVLGGEDRRRNEDRDLFACGHGLERGAHRDLGFAITDVPADEPVHRRLGLHVVLDLIHGAQLVGRLLVRKGVLELALPGSVRPECVALCRQSLRVENDELLRDLARLALHA